MRIGICQVKTRRIVSHRCVIPGLQNDSKRSVLVCSVLWKQSEALANNIALRRDAAGVHYRSDSVNGQFFLDGRQCCLDHRSLRCLFRGELGCLLVLNDEVNKCLDQIIVNLTKAMIKEAQQVQTCGCNRNSLQLVDRVELDQGGIVFYTPLEIPVSREKYGRFV